MEPCCSTPRRGWAAATGPSAPGSTSRPAIKRSNAACTFSAAVSQGATSLFSVLVSKFLAAERAPITYETDGKRRRPVVLKKIVAEVEPIAGANPGEVVKIAITSYWLGPDIVIAQSTQSRVRVFKRLSDFVGPDVEICAIVWSGP